MRTWIGEIAGMTAMKDPRLVRFAQKYGIEAADKLVAFTQSVPFSLNQVIAEVELVGPNWEIIGLGCRISAAYRLPYITTLPTKPKLVEPDALRPLAAE